MQLNRTLRPAPSIELSFKLPEIEKFKLENDLQVYFIRRTNLPIVRFNLILNSGSKFDPLNKKGLVNLFSMLIDEGAGRHNALELNEEFDLLGSNFDINSNSDNIFVSLRTLKDNMGKSLKLFSEVIINPHLDDKSFAREQRKVLTRILQLNDDPEETADIVFDSNIFGKSNPYSHPVIGYKNDVENIDNNDIKNFYRNYFSPSKAALIVVGDSEKEELKEKLTIYLGGWKEINSNHSQKIKLDNKERRIFLVNKENSVQSEIRIGHLSPERKSPDYFNRTVLNTILGGQFSSRINLNLREDKGYTYGAFSRFSYYQEAGYFYVSTSVSAVNTGNAITEIFNELNGIKNGVTSEELEFAKSSIIRKFPANFETNRQIAANISTMVVHSLPDNYFDYYLSNIKQITIDDVNSATLKSIFPDDALIVVVGCKKELYNQLKNFGREIVEIELPII